MPVCKRHVEQKVLKTGDVGAIIKLSYRLLIYCNNILNEYHSDIYFYNTWIYLYIRGEVSCLVFQSGESPKVCDSSLLIGWIYSLFLVTAVKKLPSAGAR